MPIPLQTTNGFDGILAEIAERNDLDIGLLKQALATCLIEIAGRLKTAASPKETVTEKQKELLEDAFTVYRVQRALERQVVNGTGSVTPNVIEGAFADKKGVQLDLLETMIHFPSENSDETEMVHSTPKPPRKSPNGA